MSPAFALAVEYGQTPPNPDGRGFLVGSRVFTVAGLLGIACLHQSRRTTSLTRCRFGVAHAVSPLRRLRISLPDLVHPQVTGLCGYESGSAR